MLCFRSKNESENETGVQLLKEDDDEEIDEKAVGC